MNLRFTLIARIKRASDIRKMIHCCNYANLIKLFFEVANNIYSEPPTKPVEDMLSGL